jgi:FAD dependent oxidoreductase TIGR03364
MNRRTADIAIIGAGIVGIAHALAAAKKGLKVVMFERSEQAVGASVRNFGLLWPVGQAEGKLHDRAMRSLLIWKELADSIGLYFKKSGSLHVAYHEDELSVLEEFSKKSHSISNEGKLLSAKETLKQCNQVNPENLLGSYFSPTEATVDPRQVISELPKWLESNYGVILQFSTNVRSISIPTIETSRGNWTVSRAIVCSGQDFETLYPEHFAQEPITRCKLQMLATTPQPNSWQLGSALCAGLTLLHYDNFKSCSGLKAVKERFEKTMPFYLKHGIHVLLSQNSFGELIIGDSHHYCLTVDPFDREDINQAILGYLKSFALFPSTQISRRWNGIYPKLTTGTNLILTPVNGVTIVNGLGGAGMTLSFGLAEEVLESLHA